MWFLGFLLLRRSRRPYRAGSTAGAELTLIAAVAAGLLLASLISHVLERIHP